MVVNGVTFKRTKSPWGLFYQLSQNDSELWVQLMSEIMTDFSWIEFCELDAWLKTQQLAGISQALLDHRGWNANEQFWNLTQETRQFGLNFKKWLHEKQVAPAEVSPFLSLTDESQKKFVCETLEMPLFLKSSRATGVKILELLVELKLMGLDKGLLSPQDLTAELWYERLRAQRYPETHQRAILEKTHWLSMPWMKSLQARYVRVNDRTGVEIKAFVGQKEDLQKILSNLEQVRDQWENSSR